MGLEKVGLNLAQKTSAWVKATGKGSILQTKPINTAELKGINLAQKPVGDSFSFSTKRIQELNKKADDLLAEIKKDSGAEYIERYSPDIVANVNAGNIKTRSEVTYLEFKKLESLRKEKPEVFVLLGDEKGSIYDLQRMMSYYGDDAIKIAKEMPIADIKKVISEVDDVIQKLDDEPMFNEYINMLIMKKYNPKTYEYIMKQKPKMVESWGGWDVVPPSGTMLKNITPEQVQVMSENGFRGVKHLGEYVECSDDFIDDSLAVRELSDALSKYKLSANVNLYRGDKTVGMFDNIGIDKAFATKIRHLLEANKTNAKEVKITEYTGRYGGSPTTNLYDFLSKKENLTLADAMQVVKYGDETFLKEVIERIQKSKVIDKRFKSYSFDNGMAFGWRHIHSGDNTTIVQNATVKKGTQGGYRCDNNGQYEVVLNNTAKEMTFPTATYNKDTDTFVLNTIVQNIQ